MTIINNDFVKSKFRMDKDLANIIIWLDLKLITGSCSRLFAIQLMDCVKERIYNVHMIYDEIGNLEHEELQKQSFTKPATKFKGKFLNGLLHKHHSQPMHMVKNALNHLYTKAGNKIYQNLWQKTISDESIPDEKKLGVISEFITKELINDRKNSKKYTGEWIVYARQDNRNYYLTLALHNEEDQAIRDRVFLCQTDFPHLDFYKLPTTVD